MESGCSIHKNSTHIGAEAGVLQACLFRMRGEWLDQGIKMGRSMVEGDQVSRGRGATGSMTRSPADGDVPGPVWVPGRPLRRT